MNALRHWIDRKTIVPKAPWVNREYANWKLPVACFQLDDDWKDSKYRKNCIDAILLALYKVQSRIKSSKTKCLPVAIISEPDANMSEICFFFGRDYWRGFAMRNSKNQIWKKLPPSRSLLKRNSIPNRYCFREVGYKNTDIIDGNIESGEVWLFWKNKFATRLKRQ